jgi:hypothetical protein
MRADDQLSEAWIGFFLASSLEERGRFDVVKDRSQYFMFDERSGLWHVGSAIDASNRMLHAMKTLGNGGFWESLSRPERDVGFKNRLNTKSSNSSGITCRLTSSDELISGE